MNVPSISSRARLIRGLFRRKIACAGKNLAWLGIGRRDLALSLLRRGIASISLDHHGWPATPGPSRLAPSELFPLALYPACIELESTPTELDSLPRDAVERARSRYTATASTYASQVARAMDVSRPSAVLVVQGYELFNAVARKMAIDRGLPVVAVENTALADRLLWDDESALTTNRNLAKNFFWRYESSTDPHAAARYCDELIARTKARKSEEHASPSRRYQGPRAGRPTILFIGQVYTDSAVIFGIGAWGTPTDLILALTELANDLDFNLWIKLHPKEISGNSTTVSRPLNKLTWRKLCENSRFRELAIDNPRVMIDHENYFDTYDLIAKSDAVCTLNSQTGLEAAIRGVPAVVAGQAFYGGLGFTLDADSPEVLRVQVIRALGLEVAHRRELQLRAQIFTNIYFEHYCIEKSSLSLASLIERRCF